MKQRVVCHISLEKARIDMTRRTVALPLIEPDVQNLNGLTMLRPAIVAAKDSYMLRHQFVGREHIELSDSRPTGSWIDEQGVWWAELCLTDQKDWDGVTSGAFTGGSWAGFAEVELQDGGGRICAEHAECMEISLVAKPAVPIAVFNSDELEDDEELLINRIAAGKVKPRIVANSKSGLLQKALGAITELFNSLNDTNPHLASGEESVMSSEDEMTPEQIAALKAELKAEIQAELKAELETAAESSEVTEPEPAAETSAAAPLTADAIAAALQPLINTAVEAAVTPLKEELAAIGKQSAGSQQLASDGSGEDATKPAGLRPRKRLK